MSRIVHALCAALALALATACGDPASVAAPRVEPVTLPSPESFGGEHRDFATYWHQGLAELTRYRLRQARYGETHDGEAVLIFVTEPFLPGEQLKHEHGDHPEAIGVLKLNAHRHFYTGVYPYSVLTSTFSPEAGGPDLKVTGSVQEWCGHAYTQINRREGQLHLRSHSYFQDEGDVDRRIPEAAFEDGLFATIRRDPAALPIGATELVPALHHLRFVHREVRAYRARGALDEVDDGRFGGRVRRYRVEYEDLERTLTVYFAPEHPRAILGWEEDGEGGRTEAVRTHAVLTDYWAHHGAGDAAYRAALGLE